MLPSEVIAMRDRLTSYCRRELDIEDYTRARIVAEALILSGWVVSPPKNEGENDD